ncbi:galactan 5-O-arabinofuranosyltransferase [Kibdelosporangium lantanae]
MFRDINIAIAMTAGIEPSGETDRQPTDRLPSLLATSFVRADFRGWRLLGELVAAALVAGVGSVGAQWIVARSHIDVPSFVPAALTSALSAVLVLAVLLVAVRSRFRALGRVAAWAGLAALTSSVQALMLKGTRFYLFGIGGDQQFRTEYMTRLADGSTTADFAYRDMPGFYPRGWFWLGGKLSDLFGMPAWQFYKPYAIATIAVGTVLAYVMWCQVVRPAAATLMGVAVTVVAVNSWAAYEPYAWVFGALIPPLAVLGWRYLVDREHRLGIAVLLGGVTGLLGLFYTLLLGFFVMVLVVVAVVGVTLAVRRGAPLWPTSGRAVRRLAVIALFSLPGMAAQWGPYLFGRTGLTAGGNGALSYLPATGTSFPLFLYPTAFGGVLSLVGIVWGLLRLRDNVVARALMLVAACGYLWYGLSFVLTLFDISLLPFKIEIVLNETLRCAGVLGLVDGTRRLYRTVARQWRTGVALVVVVIGVVGVVGELQSRVDPLPDLVPAAYADYYPDGTTPFGERDPGAAGAWNKRLHDTIAAMTGRAEHDLTVLSDHQDLLTYWPYWSFQVSKPEYANPLADYDGRRARIEGWAKAASAADLERTRRPGDPDVFVLRTAGDGLHLTLTRSDFPRENVRYDVVFRAALFTGPEFRTQVVGPFTVVVRRR